MRSKIQNFSIAARLAIGFCLSAAISGGIGAFGIFRTGSLLGIYSWIALITLCTGILWLLTARSIRKPVNGLIDAANRIAAGDLEIEIPAEGNDEIGKLARSVRRAMDNIKRHADAIGKIASGDITAEVTVISAQDRMGDSIHLLAETLRNIVCEIGTLTMAAMEGNLTIRGNSEQFQGGYREIVEGFNIILNAVIEPLNEAAEALQKVAGKDLTVRMVGDHNGDFAKISNSLNTAVESLDHALYAASTAAEQVSTAAEQISAGNESLSMGVSEQASSLEEVSDSLHEMASMARQTATNAKEARGLSEKSLEAVRSGVESMKLLSESILKMKSSADATAKIVKTIDEIAFQTNLLALNAAVEAARAGDAGKGFAVVAEEVRNLAMRSAEAAKNTSSMIEESIKNAEDEVRFDSEAMKCLENIDSQVNRVSTVMMEIAAAAEQQSMGVEQLNDAISNMNKVTQQSATNAEESATAAEELKRQAQNVRGMVHSFKLTHRRAAGTLKSAGGHHAANRLDTAMPAFNGIEQNDADLPLQDF